MVDRMAKSRENTKTSEKGISHVDILGQAIQKAIDNGWSFFGWWDENTRFEVGDWSDGTVDVSFFENIGGTTGEILSWTGESPVIIYNHSFAKALWGERKLPQTVVYKDGASGTNLLPNWQVQLQQMVISEDPIKYLGDHI